VGKSGQMPIVKNLSSKLKLSLLMLAIEVALNAFASASSPSVPETSLMANQENTATKSHTPLAPPTKTAPSARHTAILLLTPSLPHSSHPLKQLLPPSN
jgi:hypothetical protein